jgi:Abnormal spindle-like microcephaly-assoc'd, ASPM-SPD-2-Hydin/HYDIN/CFA65/VesB-like, Ig-like domain/Cep192 domain 4
MDVVTPDFGLVSGRVTALALDPSDATGNRLYVGTTGGGVWMANNAAVSTPASIVLTPLTDNVTALSGAVDASISIGTLTVQPGGAGVILAGTGDPNDVLDSYYGAGILRSTDGGNTWSLIQYTVDEEDGLAAQDYSFVGNGFAGFAWSTVNPQLVVAAVSQSYEGTEVDANQGVASYEGLYYSTDSGATWHLATISDGSGRDVQGPRIGFLSPNGNAVTAVVWNPVRQLFFAAVRFHGYYQSADGITWTRVAAQPGAGLTTKSCPNNKGNVGSVACPIYRGALAVNPQTGDTFAWTVDLNNQDQGLWQDQCAISGGSCTNSTILFAKQWSMKAQETVTPLGVATIADGEYNLALAAIPTEQDTILLAGANDLWRCSLAMGCAWRNTTNSTTCMSAQVGEFQHTVAWNPANPLEVFLGNDSGLWRSMDAIGETDPVCSATDATHFQNLNGSLGSLAEVGSMSQVVTSPYSMMAGLGVNGTAGVNGTTATADWPQILSGYGGPVAVDPINGSAWYVNNQSGVSIYRCSQNAPCTPAAFGTNPVVGDADVGGDGDAMPTPAPFILDPLDPGQLLIGTCRVWRGPFNGGAWGAGNAISPTLDTGVTGVSCQGDALIRSMAAMPLANGSEIVVVGMYGLAYNGVNLPGHVLTAIFNPASSGMPVWHDLTQNPVINDSQGFNYYGLDISSVAIDSHDATGNTLYVTVEGMENPQQKIQVVYRSTNRGASWSDITANLPAAPANSLAIDPQNANTVYVATDRGVFFTTRVANCAQDLSNCWSVFGSGLPAAPAVALSTSPAGSSAQVLVAATYGRGIWQAPLWSAGTDLTAAAATPASLNFPGTVFGAESSAITVSLQNTGNATLSPTSIAMSGDFSETDNCVNQTIAVGASCSIQVTFTPQTTGPLAGQMTVFANVYGGQLSVDLKGTGTPAGEVTLSPPSVNFGQVEVGSTSSLLQITVANSSAAAVPISSISITPPFAIASNACGASSLTANADCQLQVVFAPTQPGPAMGLLTFADGAGVQTVGLNGTGEAAPTDILNVASLTFPATAEGQLSDAQPITITNTGGMPLTSISISASGEFRQSNTCGTQLAAGVVCNISVKFAPTQIGALTGTLTFADALRTQSVSLSGTGLAPPAFSVNPASLNFNNQQPGLPSAPQTVTITNNGGAPMANIGFQITGAAASSYSVGATTCGTVLNSGNSCTVQIAFTPGATGAIAAALAISSSTAGVPAVAVPLNGSGQLTSGLSTNPSQINFPVVAAGQSSTEQQITVTNSSSYAIGSVTLAASAPFSLAQNACNGNLDAGANCTAAVIFQPNAGGSASGVLTVSSAAVATPVSVALSGVGFDFSVASTGPASQTVARDQQARYTLVISPTGTSGTFTFTCGTLPANANCLFNPSSESLNAGMQGNVEVQVSTGGATAQVERPSVWRALSLACALLFVPFTVRRRRRLLLFALLAAVLVVGDTSCASSGGGVGGGSGVRGGGSSTLPGTYTIPVNVTSTGTTHTLNLTLTVD